MKLKKVAAVCLTTAMAASLAACGGSGSSSGSNGSAEINYADVKVGEDFKDVKTTIKFLTNRTDMQSESYKGKNWNEYIADFNKIYPDITVEIDGITDYSNDALLRLQGSDWGDLMLIPDVDKQDLSKYYLSYGDLETMKNQVNYAGESAYDGQVYGIASSADARGIVYNKKVFEQAGIKTLPKTPEEFMNALKAIKENTEAIPLYTNYAAGWTMAAWDDYVGSTSTGDAQFLNQKLPHTAEPFKDPGDGTHPYNVYKILYDAVSEGYTEDDFSTTDWESSKSMLNSGKVGCMALGSWCFQQMQQAGPNADDIGYMAFPISVNGKQYATASPNYRIGINAKASEDNQKAAMVFVKWLTEQSKYSYNEGSLPIKADDKNYPDVFKAFTDNNVEFISDETAVSGEEDLLNTLNADSELSISANGYQRIQTIVEHASNKDKSYDDIMAEWNKKWSDALEADGVEVKY